MVFPRVGFGPFAPLAVALNLVQALTAAAVALGLLLSTSAAADVTHTPAAIASPDKPLAQNTEGANRFSECVINWPSCPVVLLPTIDSSAKQCV